MTGERFKTLDEALAAACQAAPAARTGKRSLGPPGYLDPVPLLAEAFAALDLTAVGGNFPAEWGGGAERVKSEQIDSLTDHQRHVMLSYLAARFPSLIGPALATGKVHPAEAGS